MLRVQVGATQWLAVRAEADEVVGKGNQLAFGIEPGLKFVPTGGPEKVALEVFLTVPKQLHGLPRQRLCDGGGLHHVVHHQPAPEAATGASDVHLLLR